jgi:hypothetical protein
LGCRDNDTVRYLCLLGEKNVSWGQGGDRDSWTKAIPSYLKALAILGPWMVQIAVSDTEEKIEELLDKVSNTERNLSTA